MFCAGIELNIGLEDHLGVTENSTVKGLPPVAKEDDYTVCWIFQSLFWP